MYAQDNFYAQVGNIVEFTNEFDAPTSYIDARDLAEVLEAYFQGTLNDMDEYLLRLYKELHEFHPTNSLYGQLDQDELHQCLSKLTKLERAVLEYKFTESKASQILLTHFYVQARNSPHFVAWVEELYIEAIEMLSYEILEIL